MARPKKAAASPRAASPAPVTTRRRASSKSAATAAPATPRASTPAKLATPANKSASTPRAATPAKPTTPPAAAKTTSKVATPRAATPRAATPAKAVKAATTPRPPFVSAYESPAAVVSSAPAPASLAFGWYSPLIVYTVLSFIAFACFLYEAGHEQTYAVKCAFLVNLFVCVALALFLLPPIPQSLAYHNFADQRQLCCGVPNTFDVSSNLPYLLFGLLGVCVMVPRALQFLIKSAPGVAAHLFGGAAPNASVVFLDSTERMAWWIFFAGCTLTAFGSAYYHWRPTNARLVWDRLPMTLGFMAIYSIVLHDRLQLHLIKAGSMLTLPEEFEVSATLAGVKAWLPIAEHIVVYLPAILAVVGVLSVAHWARTDDLRPYLFVQFYPLCTIPVLMSLFPSQFSHQHLLVWSLVWYGVAKVLEVLDRSIFAWTRGLVSGHTLKHLVSSLSMLFGVLLVAQRQKL